MGDPDNDNMAVPPRISGELSHVLERAGEAALAALAADPDDTRAMGEAAASVVLKDMHREQNEVYGSLYGSKIIEAYAHSIDVDITSQEPTDGR